MKNLCEVEGYSKECAGADVVDQQIRYYNKLKANYISGSQIPAIQTGSQIPSSLPGIKMASPVYAKKQKRNRMAKKSRSINRKK